MLSIHHSKKVPVAGYVFDIEDGSTQGKWMLLTVYYFWKMWVVKNIMTQKGRFNFESYAGFIL